MKRIESPGKRWRATYRKNGVCALVDARKGNSGRPRGNDLSIEEKYILIHDVLQKYKLKNKIQYFCKLLGVSRSGYYNYFSFKSQNVREQRKNIDNKVKEIILKAYYFKNRKKGARQLKTI